MRTSKLSRETAQLFASSSSSSSSSLSSSHPLRRSTRQASKTISAFALKTKAGNSKEEIGENDHTARGSPLDTAVSTDIEDSLLTSVPTSDRKRKRGQGPVVSPATTVVSISTNASKRSRISGRRVKEESEEEDRDDTQQHLLGDVANRSLARSQTKLPARTVSHPDGSRSIVPPSNWLEIYTLVRDMRRANPTAPVDTMGCETLFWRHSPLADQRYHRLVALMLSSQTKDTVTAVAMDRLHTEMLLDPSTDGKKVPIPTLKNGLPSHLSISNIIDVTPTHLNSLISKVGFHNTKTKALQATALILRDKFSSDVPRTLPELLSLPGVGPKMAFLALSACWDIDLGIGVDTHVHRITNLWGWNAKAPGTKTAEETRKCLEAWLPREMWHEINTLLVGLGQTVCLPIGRRCGECVLQGKGLCKGEVKRWKDGRAGRVKREKIEVKDEVKIEVKHEIKEEMQEDVNPEVKIEIVTPIKEEAVSYTNYPLER